VPFYVSFSCIVSATAKTTALNCRFVQGLYRYALFCYGFCYGGYEIAVLSLAPIGKGFDNMLIFKTGSGYDSVQPLPTDPPKGGVLFLARHA